MKVLTTILAIALGLWVCGTAVAAPVDLHNPNQAAPAPATHQDLRNADQVAPARGNMQDLRNPDRVAPEPAIVMGAPAAPAPAATSPALPAPDGGLSALLIVLISVGAATALAGASYAVMRVAHAYGHAAT
jgi:hypothetical protein